jgi:TetR/AcrR family transcriptional repressor of bet genes
MGRPSNTEERRAQIVEALGAVMAKEGYARATITAIARQARLAPGLIHYHFKDKDEILVELVATLADRLERRVERRLADAGTPRARLHALVDAHVGLGDDAEPEAVAAWSVVAAEAMRRDEVRVLYARAIESTLARLEHLLSAALRAERKSARDAKRLAAALVAAIEGAYLLHASAPGVLPAGYAGPALHALVDGLLRE